MEKKVDLHQDVMENKINIGCTKQNIVTLDSNIDFSLKKNKIKMALKSKIGKMIFLGDF